MSESESLVERVARAICRANSATTDFPPGYTLDDEVENAWDLWVPEAVAAIDAALA